MYGRKCFTCAITTQLESQKLKSKSSLGDRVVHETQALQIHELRDWLQVYKPQRDKSAKAMQRKER